MPRAKAGAFLFLAYVLIFFYMVVRMRHTRAHTANRRSHHALIDKKLNVCKNCGNKVLPHVACAKCGTYKGRNVVDTVKKVEKKQAKKKARSK